METRKVLLFMSLVFSVVLLVQYIELPYGYFLSSLLSLGKSQVKSSDGATNLVNQTSFCGAKINATRGLQKEHDLRPETSKKSGNFAGDSNDREGGHSSSNILGTNISFVPGRNHTTREEQAKNTEKSSLTRSDLATFVNNFSVATNPANKKRFKGPPAVVVPISEMSNMMIKSRVSFQSMKSKRPSEAEKELLNAKKLIESAEKKPQIDVTSVYRNYPAFLRSYELMEQTLKIYTYAEGERPTFHEPELNGIYASEGWFMKQLQENEQFVTENPDKAHLFYLPFSSHVLQEVLYVPSSHSRKNLVRYLNSYLHNITTIYPFWNRASGADHFLVACHDWSTNGVCSNSRSVRKGDIRKKRGKFRLDHNTSTESVGSNTESCPHHLKRLGKMQNGRQDKVNWSRESEAQFVILCHQEYLNGQLLTTCFSPPTLKQICSRLNALVGGNVNYGVPQLRTKWKNVKRAWKLLYTLRFIRGSGLGWDPDKETIVGTVDQMESIYAEHRDNKAIIKHGLPHFDLCSEMFNKKVATGNYTRSSMQPPPPRSSMQPPSESEAHDDDDDTVDSTPPSVDSFAPSQSEYNFTPNFSSRDAPESSNRGRRKRTSSSNDRDALLIQTLTNFNGYVTEKRTQASREREEYNTCLGILHAMDNISPRIQIKAGERLGGATTRHMFLLYDENQRRNWLMSLDGV